MYYFSKTIVPKYIQLITDKYSLELHFIEGMNRIQSSDK